MGLDFADCFYAQREHAKEPEKPTTLYIPLVSYPEENIFSEVAVIIPTPEKYNSSIRREEHLNGEYLAEFMFHNSTAEFMDGFKKRIKELYKSHNIAF